MCRGGFGAFQAIFQAQSDDQVFEQLWQVPCALLVAKTNAAQCRNLFHPFQPAFDQGVDFPLQNRGNAFNDVCHFGLRSCLYGDYAAAMKKTLSKIEQRLKVASQLAGALISPFCAC